MISNRKFVGKKFGSVGATKKEKKFSFAAWLLWLQDSGYGRKGAHGKPRRKNVGRGVVGGGFGGISDLRHA